MMAEFLPEAEDEMMEAAVFYQDQADDLGEMKFSSLRLHINDADRTTGRNGLETV